MSARGWPNLIVRLRWLTIALFSAVTVFFALQLPKSELDTEMKNQLPKDLPTRVNLDKIEELFGGTDMLMIVLSTDDVLKQATLQRLQKLTLEMQRVDEIERVVSVFTAKDLKGDGFEMIVEPAVDAIATLPEARQQLRKRLRENPLVYGNLISRDFKDAVVIGFLKPGASDEAVVAKVRSLAKQVAGSETTLVGGMPVTRVSLTEDMRKDMRRFLPVGLLLMLVFLLVCFRQARGVLLPFIMTVMAIVVAMGAIPLLGWKIHTVTILLPVILLAVANDYGIHLLSRYQEDNAPGTEHSSSELARRGVLALGRPVLATGLTTIVGMLCLLSHLVIPAKQLGVLAGIGVAFAMLGSLLFIPAVLAVLPRAKPLVIRASTQTESSGLERLLSFFAASVAARPRSILLGALLISVVVGAGATRIVVDTNPMSFYEPTEPVWRSTHVLNDKLGGWAGISVIFEGDIKDPKVLREIDQLERYLKQHELVGTTNSIAAVMRKMNQVMHEGNPKFDRIPETRELVAQYLLLYSMSGDPSDFEKLVDFPYRHAQVMAKITESGTSAATRLLADVRAYRAQHQQAPIQRVGGFLDVMADMVHHIVWGQVTSMALAALLVWLLVSAVLRSLIAGLMAVAPLLLALLMIFGVMGFFGIELNLVTALLSSIMIGVGVDYSIHFLWRYRDERRAGASCQAAVQRTLTTAGRGIVFNALSVVVGFSVLAISAFYPVRFFGLLVAISIFASLLGALVVLPAIAILLRPKFLEPLSTNLGAGEHSQAQVSTAKAPSA